jgi:hypothetical protein
MLISFYSSSNREAEAPVGDVYSINASMHLCRYCHDHYILFKTLKPKPNGPGPLVLRVYDMRSRASCTNAAAFIASTALLYHFILVYEQSLGAIDESEGQRVAAVLEEQSASDHCWSA